MITPNQFDECDRTEAEWVEDVREKIDAAIEASRHTPPIDLTSLETMLHNGAIAKLEDMGYKPTLRYWDTPDRLRPCLLLKAVQLKTDEEEPFDEELEILFPLFENAVRSPRRPKNYCPKPATKNEITLVSA